MRAHHAKLPAMEKIGIRALRQHADAVLKRVQMGESLEVTDRGRPIALLLPVDESRALRRLRRAGRVVRARGDLLELEPLRPKRGVELPSKRLRAMRKAER